MLTILKRRTLASNSQVAFQSIPANGISFMASRNEIPREEACKVLRRPVDLWLPDWYVAGGNVGNINV
jgi:hypothetical protein